MTSIALPQFENDYDVYKMRQLVETLERQFANIQEGGDGSGGGGGAHNDLTGRTAADCHPTSAITGLDATLTSLAGSIATNTSNISVNAGNISTIDSTLTTHIGDAAIHFTDAPADGTDYVRNNNAWVSGGGGVTDHGALTGLADDDHTQYLNTTRADASYLRLDCTNDPLTGALDTQLVQPDSDVARDIGTPSLRYDYMHSARLFVHNGSGTATNVAGGNLIGVTGTSGSGTSTVAVTDGATESAVLFGAAITGGGSSGDATMRATTSGTMATGISRSTGAGDALMEATGVGCVVVGAAEAIAANATIEANVAGSFAFGFCEGTSGTALIRANGNGAMALGFVDGSGGTVQANNGGAFCHGRASGGAVISASGVGSFVNSESSAGTLNASGTAAVILGRCVGTTPVMTASGRASFICGETNTGSMTTSGVASMATGQVVSTGIMRTNAGSNGSRVGGFAQGLSEVSNRGSWAYGYTTTGTATLQATANASWAFGEAGGGETIAATATNAMQLAPGTNNQAVSFQVGIAGTGIAIKGTSGAFGTPADGQIYNDSGSVTVRSNGKNIALDVAQTYTPSNVVTDRSYDANSTTVDELADVLGTLIADLQTAGFLD